ncbi:type II secretion system protein N [Sphingomonas fennica]|nr:PDZ domain-containing protein [Sphingomonas fennica]
MATRFLPSMAGAKAQGSAREWMIAIGAGLLLSAGLVALIRPAPPEGDSGEAAVSAPSPITAEPQTPPPPAMPEPQPAPAAPSANISGLILRGVMGPSATGAAIIEFPGGRQGRFVVGREVLPGVVVKAIEPQSILLSANGTESRLALPGADIASLGGPARPAAPPDLASQTNAFRTGLTPVKRADGRVTGFTIREGVNMPAFAGAGLRPGDVIVGVNGRAFASEDEVNKLANEIAISPMVTFKYRRNNRTMEARLETTNP